MCSLIYSLLSHSWIWIVNCLLCYGPNSGDALCLTGSRAGLVILASAGSHG